MSGDLLFPLPDPGAFLPYVNCVTVWRQSLAEPSVDVNGAVTQRLAVAVVLSETYVAMADQVENEDGDTNLEQVSIVILARNGSAVSHADEVTVAGVSQYLDGRYRVNAVRPNPSHLRILCSRMTEAPITVPSGTFPSPVLYPSPALYPGV
jgi:hypothetical protein